jgi:hypothetical protein
MRYLPILLLLFVTLFLFGCSSSKQQEAVNYSLNLTLEQLRANLEKLNNGYIPMQSDPKEGSFKIPFTRDVMISGKINPKDNSVRSVSIYVYDASSDVLAYKAITVMELFIGLLNPEITSDERAGILDACMKNGGITISHGRKYYLEKTDETVMLRILDPADNAR